MELRHIRYFLALATALNFSRAAEKLHIAQPSLSRQIRELEEKVGAQLFYRTKRQVQLTNAGKVFQQKAILLLEQLEQACISARLSSTGKEGELQIGFNGVIQDLIPTLKQYRDRYPQVAIILNQMDSTMQLNALNTKEIDLAIITIPVTSDKIKVVPLPEMKFMAALPRDHSLATKRTLS